MNGMLKLFDEPKDLHQVQNIKMFMIASAPKGVLQWVWNQSLPGISSREKGTVLKAALGFTGYFTRSYYYLENSNCICLTEVLHLAGFAQISVPPPCRFLYNCCHTSKVWNLDLHMESTPGQQ